MKLTDWFTRDSILVGSEREINQKKGVVMAQKSSVISGMGVVLSIVQTFVASVKEKVGGVFTLVVNYRILKDLIAAGRYDWVNDDITEENFPAEKEEQGTKEQSFTLYHFGEDMRSDDIVAQMQKNGKRPATIRELLVFAEKYPKPQRKFLITALKSVWVDRYGHCRVLCLVGGTSGRGLYLGCYDGIWLGGCRFLAVGK